MNSLDQFRLCETTFKNFHCCIVICVLQVESCDHPSCWLFQVAPQILEFVDLCCPRIVIYRDLKSPKVLANLHIFPYTCAFPISAQLHLPISIRSHHVILEVCTVTVILLLISLISHLVYIYIYQYHEMVMVMQKGELSNLTEVSKMKKSLKLQGMRKIPKAL